MQTDKRPHLTLDIPPRTGFIYMLLFALHRLAEHVDGDLTLCMGKQGQADEFFLSSKEERLLHGRSVILDTKLPAVRLTDKYSHRGELQLRCHCMDPVTTVTQTDRHIWVPVDVTDGQRAMKLAWRTAAIILNYLLYAHVPESFEDLPESPPMTNRIGEPIPIDQFLKGPLL